MPEYHSAFNTGETVGVADSDVLRAFQQSWEWHDPLTDAQLAYAGREDRIAVVRYYHGGTPLYELAGTPGVWHEECLRDLTLSESYDREAGVPAADYYTIATSRRDGLAVVIVRDPSGREVLSAFQFAPDHVAEAMRAVARVRSRIAFEHKYGFGGIYEANRQYLDRVEPVAAPDHGGSR
jgi:hypothetical protein